MKKIIALAIVLVAAAAFSADWTAYDMADYGTTASITNTADNAAGELTYALITNDASSTNTVTVYVTKAGVDYKIGSATITANQYGSIDLTDMLYASDDVLKITATDTNSVVLIKSE